MIEADKIVKSNRRTLCLHITQDGKLFIKAPKKMSLETILGFVKEKENWIEKKQKKAREIIKNNYEIFNYNSILFLGKKYKVMQVKGINTLQLCEDFIEIPDKNYVEKEIWLKKWYLTFVNDILFKRIDYIGKLMNLQASGICIINSKAKWGMCNQNGKLFFNWRMLMLEPKMMDYIIIHEFSHLRVLNHSKCFWEIVESIMPDYKLMQKKLNDCGFLIKLF